MSQEGAIVADFKASTDNYWTTRTDYDTVNAILIHWKDDDLGIEPEVRKLFDLLQDEFNFKARMYLIPNESPEAMLQYELAAFIVKSSLSPRSLTIVYYAGHGENSVTTDNTEYSQWRAQEVGGPTLNWSRIQYSLYAAKGDVLIVMDCCHAAHRIRGFKEGKMEILAACGVGSRVPGRARNSFTSVFTRQLKRYCAIGQPVSVKSLHNRLWDDKTEPRLTVTPVYFDLSNEDRRSIILQPIQLPAPPGFERRETPASAFVFLRVSLQDDPTGLQIANWLKSFPPQSVQGVDIEGLVLKARSLECIKEHRKLLPGSILESLTQSAQSEILQNVRSLSHTVAATAAYVVGATTSVGAATEATAIDSDLAVKTIADIKENVANVCNSVEAGILLSSDIKLEDVIDDEISIAVGAQDGISLRQQILNEPHISKDLELNRDAVKFNSFSRGAAAKNRFRFADVDGIAMVVESFQYSYTQESSDASQDAMLRLKRIVGLLSHDKRTSQYVLECRGYIQERHLSRISLVFRAPREDDTQGKPTTLFDSYMKHRRVSLGNRLQLALAIAIALEGLHRVGWVHKNLKSDNFLLLNTAQKTKPAEESKVGASNDLDINVIRPCLFGFEWSRPEGAHTDLNTDYSTKNNAYRHPERWGKPRIKFVKHHDVYSLGIILLEIAYWRPILQFASMKQDAMDPFKIRAEFLQAAEKDLPHMVGQSFTDAIVACLTFEEMTRDRTESDMHHEFKEKILEKLKRVAEHV